VCNLISRHLFVLTFLTFLTFLWCRSIVPGVLLDKPGRGWDTEAHAHVQGVINWLPALTTSAYLPNTRKVWTLAPPADQPYVGELTITQRPGDVLYLPPAWSHSVSLCPFLPPMPSSPNDARVFRSKLMEAYRRSLTPAASRLVLQSPQWWR